MFCVPSPKLLETANFLSVDSYYMVTKWIVAELKEELRSGSHNSPLATNFVWKKYIKRD